MLIVGIPYITCAQRRRIQYRWSQRHKNHAHQIKRLRVRERADCIGKDTWLEVAHNHPATRPLPPQMVWRRRTVLLLVGLFVMACGPRVGPIAQTTSLPSPTPTQKSQPASTPMEPTPSVTATPTDD